MPTYGEWLSHDYQKTAGVIDGEAGTLGQAESGPFPDSYYGQADIETTVNAAFGAEAPVTIGSLKYQIDLDRVAASPTWERYYRATVGAATGRRVAATVGGMTDNSFSPTLPPGATGWEWDWATGARVVTATATLTFNGVLQDHTLVPFQSATGGEAYLQVRTSTGVLLAEETIYRAAGVVTTDTLPITSYVNPTSGEVRFDLMVRHVKAPEPLAPLAEGSIYLNGGVSVVVEYALTQRYRFVYPGTTPPQRPAPLRIVQRGSDGLGMTGGRRIVQNRTLQSTNRRGAAIR